MFSTVIGEGLLDVVGPKQRVRVPGNLGTLPLLDLNRGSILYLGCLAAVAITAFGGRLLFWLWTQWTIEDALIIGRMVRNLVEHGELTFNLGQRASAATSPLFAALVGMLAWPGIDPLAATKILGLVASTLTCILVFDLLCQFRPPTSSVAGGMVYVLLPPVVAYAIGGMETAVYTLVCAIALVQLLRGHEVAAMAWGSTAMVFRPDGAVLLVVVGATVLWRSRGDLPRFILTMWPVFLIVPAGLAMHWAYYGSLLPQSAAAKLVGYSVEPLGNVLRYLNRMVLSQPGGVVIYLLAVWGTWWSVRRWPRLLPFVIWYVVYHAFFMLRAPLFDWYLQPPLFVLSLFAGLGILSLVEVVAIQVGRANWIRFGHMAAGSAITLVLIAAVILYGRERSAAQYYEDQVRGKAGRWLAENTSPDSLVFTESLGYIGYQTPNPFVDWPGLVSPGVTQLLITTRSTGFEGGVL